MVTEKKLRFVDAFGKLAAKAAGWVGSPWAFIAALAIVIFWVASGPRYHYSDTWQLVINTGTTIITFLIVFLIQNTQNRDARAIHLKLDELIRSVQAAHNEMISVEKLSDAELEILTNKIPPGRGFSCTAPILAPILAQRNLHPPRLEPWRRATLVAS